MLSDGTGTGTLQFAPSSLDCDIKIALTPGDRAVLHDRIATRFETMLELGLISELRKLRADFALDLSLEIGRAFRVQGSTNLVVWTDVTNFTSTGLAFQFLDAAATNQTRRFYRVVSP